MERINKECKTAFSGKDKIISASARNLLQNHPWPGNIREMLNTLTRAYIWSAGEVIQGADIRDALLPVPIENSGFENILSKPITQGVDLPAIMQTVAAHYLGEALKESNGNKAKASILLNITNYQTLTNWMKKYGVE
jgi:DNA-binding NtrC family response regulator